MSTTAIPTLPRMNLATIEETAQDSRIDLAVKAEALLGYNTLANAYVNCTTFLYALRELGIVPLDTNAVHKYKASKEKTGTWHSTKLAFRYVISSALLAVSAAAILTLTPATHGKGSPLDWAMFVCCVLGCLICFIHACVNAGETGQHSWNYRTGASWQQCGLDGYDGIVPLFVLSKAVEIKEKIPTVHFSVDQLNITKETGQRDERVYHDPDPFLIARRGREAYYIDVWDERDYENQMM